MGIGRSKPWAPDKYFVSSCKKQGFVAISPPVYLSKKEIHTIDLGFDGKIYYVQRRKKDLSVKNACSANIDMLREEVVLIYKEKSIGNEKRNETRGEKEHETIVLKGFSILDNGNLYVTSTDGNYVVKKEDYVHENLPTFYLTGNQEYDRLRSLFQEVDLYIVDLTPKN